jgi:hypothetical protein
VGILEEVEVDDVRFVHVVHIAIYKDRELGISTALLAALVASSRVSCERWA